MSGVVDRRLCVQPGHCLPYKLRASFLEAGRYCVMVRYTYGPDVIEAKGPCERAAAPRPLIGAGTKAECAAVYSSLSLIVEVTARGDEAALYQTITSVVQCAGRTC